MPYSIGRPVGSSYMDGTHIPAATEFYQGGLMPEVFSMTRSAYETLLRFLVTRIPNVRFAKGTVTGIHVDKLDSKRIESVSYRGGADGTTTNTQTAKLIIGMPGKLLLRLFHLLVQPFRRLYRSFSCGLHMAEAGWLYPPPKGGIRPTYAVLHHRVHCRPGDYGEDRSIRVQGPAICWPIWCPYIQGTERGWYHTGGAQPQQVS